MKICTDEALEIALDAKESAGFDAAQCVGSYILWRLDESFDGYEYTVCIHKQHNDGKDGYAVCVTAPDQTTEFYYTESLSEYVLSDKLMKIARSIESSEMRNIYGIARAGDSQDKEFILFNVYETNQAPAEDGCISLFIDTWHIKENGCTIDYEGVNGLYTGYKNPVELLAGVLPGKKYNLFKPCKELEQVMAEGLNPFDEGFDYEDFKDICTVKPFQKDTVPVVSSQSNIVSVVKHNDTNELCEVYLLGDEDEAVQFVKADIEKEKNEINDPDTETYQKDNNVYELIIDNDKYGIDILWEIITPKVSQSVGCMLR